MTPLSGVWGHAAHEAGLPVGVSKVLGGQLCDTELPNAVCSGDNELNPTAGAEGIRRPRRVPFPVLFLRSGGLGSDRRGQPGQQPHRDGGGGQPCHTGSQAAVQAGLSLWSEAPSWPWWAGRESQRQLRHRRLISARPVFEEFVERQL